MKAHTPPDGMRRLIDKSFGTVRKQNGNNFSYKYNIIKIVSYRKVFYHSFINPRSAAGNPGISVLIFIRTDNIFHPYAEVFCLSAEVFYLSAEIFPPNDELYCLSGEVIKPSAGFFRTPAE
jgi:hypothetical protein